VRASRSNLSNHATNNFCSVTLPSVRFSFLHEVGHFLDNYALMPGTPFATSLAKTNDLAEWMSAVRKSPEIISLRLDLANKKDIAKTGFPGPRLEKYVRLATTIAKSIGCKVPVVRSKFRAYLCGNRCFI
jgi:hypothetical protein